MLWLIEPIKVDVSLGQKTFEVVHVHRVVFNASLFPRRISLLHMLFGIGFGIWAALRKGKVFDHLSLTGTLIVVAVPVFVLGYVAQWIFGVKLGWVAPAGIQDGWPKSYIVPAAVLFDLSVVRPGDDPRARPDAQAGYAACEAATCTVRPASGNVGAGAGATVGKMFGMAGAMKGGIGSASVKVGDFTVGAIVACNALGDVVDPATGRILAGARQSDKIGRASCRERVSSPV